MVIASGLMVREDDTKPRAYKLVTRLLIYLLTFALFRTHAKRHCQVFIAISFSREILVLGQCNV